MSLETLIDVEGLKRLIDIGNKYCIVDCRFNLADTEAGRKDWQVGHIPGAFYAHLDEQLSGKLVPGKTGRHPLPEKTDFLGWLTTIGVDPDTQVIAYDASGGAYAARLWWLCRWIGHSCCAVLDGGVQAWNKIDDLVTKEPSERRSEPLPDRSPLLEVFTTRDILHNKSLMLIDAREPARYRGDAEPIDPVAGHIPGAVCLPFTDNLGKDGLFLDRSSLAERYRLFTKSRSGKTPVMYCGSGVTAAHNVLAMTHAGLPSPALYADSWSGWITDPDRPVAIGENDDGKVD